MAGTSTLDGEVVYRIPALGTMAELVVTDPGCLVAAASVLRSELEHIDQVASRFRVDSEVSQLQTACGRAVVVSPDLFELLVVSLQAAEATDGAVDPTVGGAMNRLGYDRDFADIIDGATGCLPEPAPVPGWKSIELDVSNSTVRIPTGTQLDLGATAKAWSADRAAVRVFNQLGCGVLVSLGGDIAVSGPPPSGGFRIGLGDIAGGLPTGGAVAIRSGGLATSGIAVRQWRLGGRLVHHILDPSTGLPVKPIWRTVSVAAASCVDANTASTAAMVKGPDALSWLAARSLPSRLVEWDGKVSCLADWPVDPQTTVAHPARW
ncbi:MAG TPA: FAD:protein FMN transferase [Acidimicrobiales bacterium]|nr:FAD:protein FMN transferase [Acidimicrobiales bacterium]